MAKVKYIRVSTTHQSTARQEENIKAEGFDKVFIDKASGKDTDRVEFQKMMDYIREGDVVYFESFSRISRSLTDLLNILDTFASKGVCFVSEKEGVSTEGATGKLVVSVLGAISQYEREINAERREYGYKKALEKGIVGRPKTAIDDKFINAYNEWKGGKITAVEATRKAGVSKATFYKMAREYVKKG